MSRNDFEALTRCASELSPELLDRAAGEVLQVWWRRRRPQGDGSTEDYFRLFKGVAALSPLVAVRLGVEIRRWSHSRVPSWAVLEKRRDGEAVAAELEESLLRALLLQFQEAAHRKAEP